MARLQELLGNTLVRSLGLEDALNRRERETQQLVESERIQGRAQAEQIRGEASQKRGMFETIGTIIGTGAGLAITGGSPQGAAVGASIGQTAGGFASGVRPTARSSETSQAIQQGIGAFGQISAAKDKKRLLGVKESKELLKEGYDPKAIKKYMKTKDIEDLTFGGSLNEDQKKSITTATDKLISSVPYKSAESSLTDLDNSLALLETNPLGEKASIISFISAFQSRISDFDVQFQLDQGVLNNLDRRLKEAKGSGVGQTTVNRLREAVLSMRKEIVKKGNNAVDKRSKLFKSIHKRFPTKDIDTTFNLLKLTNREGKKVSKDEKVEPVGRNPSGQIVLSDGTVISREEAVRRFGG